MTSFNLWLKNNSLVTAGIMNSKGKSGIYEASQEATLGIQMHNDGSLDLGRG